MSKSWSWHLRLWTLYLFGLAYLFGGWFLTGYFKSIGTEPENGGVEILVASKPIPDGTYLENPEQFFRKQKFLISQLPAGSYTSFEQVKNQYLKGTLRGGEFITLKELRDPLFIAPPPGTYCAGVRVQSIDANQDSPIFGSYFKLFLEVKSGEKVEYKIIFKKVLLLSVDSWGKACQPFVCTLALTAEKHLKVRLLADKECVFHLSRYVAGK